MNTLKTAMDAQTAQAIKLIRSQMSIQELVAVWGAYTVFNRQFTISKTP